MWRSGSGSGSGSGSRSVDYYEEDGRTKMMIKKESSSSCTNNNISSGKAALVGLGRTTRSFYYCQVDDCGADLAEAKSYHKRHKICDTHFKADCVLLAGVCKRFCQQCSRFHSLPEFDDVKRSCKRSLAGHNQRRRKTNAADSRQPSAQGTTTADDDI